jgi:Zn-dependent M28 family amino/carboxypeptidase
MPNADLANVEVRVPGASGDAPILLVSAHFDSVATTPGADDNGSGTAGLLELARRLVGRRFEAELRLVFFDCEEPGMIGSGAYVLALSKDERERLIGVINMETLGFTDRSADSQDLPPGARLVFDPGDRGDFLLILGNLQSRSLAGAVEESMEPEEGPGFRVEVFSKLPGAGWLMPDSRRSDHSRFWDADIPALLLTDTANHRSPHYHRSSDVVETMDLEFLAAAIRGVERAIGRIAVSRTD